jgi:hypothetical protein
MEKYVTRFESKDVMRHVSDGLTNEKFIWRSEGSSNLLQWDILSTFV